MSKQYWFPFNIRKMFDRDLLSAHQMDGSQLRIIVLFFVAHASITLIATEGKKSAQALAQSKKNHTSNNSSVYYKKTNL